MRTVPATSLVLAVLSTVAVAVPTAATARSAAPAPAIQLLDLTVDGAPTLGVNDVPPEALFAWTRCTPDCSPEVIGTGPTLSPGPTPAGTTFRVMRTLGDTVEVSEPSPVWQGQVANATPPTSTVSPGTAGPVVGQTLTPAPGSWTGGWASDDSLLGLRACPGPTDVGCVAMNASILQPGNRRTVVIDPAYAGWYVGAVESRHGSGSAFTMQGYPQQFVGISRFPAPQASATTALGALSGPVLADPTATPTPTPTPTRPPEPTPQPVVPAPKAAVSLRKTAKRDGKRRIVGTLTCSERCTAAITFRQGARRMTQAITLKGGETTRKASIVAPSSLSRKKKVTVTVAFKTHAVTRTARVALS